MSSLTTNMNNHVALQAKRSSIYLTVKEGYVQFFHGHTKFRLCAVILIQMIYSETVISNTDKKKKL